MNSRMTVHVDDERLLEFLDGELATQAANAVREHTQRCVACKQRLEELHAASAAFTEWEQRAAQRTAANWPSLAARLDAVDQERASGRFRWRVSAGTLALAASVVLAVILFRGGPIKEPTVEEVLTRAVHIHQPSQRNVRVSAFGSAVIRPAVLSGDAASQDDGRVRTLFVEARYDWTEPLSAKAYLSWRGQLARHHDAVLVKGGPQAQDRTYIVRTDTDSSSLRAASLTIRAGDLRPVEGSFEFGNLGTVQISEAAEPSTLDARQTIGPPASPPPQSAERTEELRPEDALHVLAALNRAGADVGEPLELGKDALGRKLVVTSNGVSEAVQRRIQSELAGLTSVEVRIQTHGDARVSGSGPEPSTQVSDQRPRAIVALLEERLGGPLKLQSVTEEVLEASGESLARAHALELLAQWVPRAAEQRLSDGDRRLLQSLREQHHGAMRRSAERMESLLRPIVGDVIAPEGAHPFRLMGAARRLNRDLSLLLAGAYSQAEGERVMRALRPDLEDLRGAITADSNARR